MESEYLTAGDYYQRHSQVIGKPQNSEYRKFENPQHAGEPSMMVYERAAIFLEQYKPRKTLLKSNSEYYTNESVKQEQITNCDHEINPNIDNKNVCNEKSSWRFVNHDTCPIGHGDNVGNKDIPAYHEPIYKTPSQVSIRPQNINHYEMQYKGNDMIDRSQKDNNYGQRDYNINPKELIYSPKDLHYSPKDLHYSPKDLHYSQKDINHCQKDYSPMDYNYIPKDNNYSSMDNNYNQKEHKMHSNYSPYHMQTDNMRNPSPMPIIETDQLVRNRVAYPEFQQPTPVEISRVSAMVEPKPSIQRVNSELVQYTSPQPDQRYLEEQAYGASGMSMVANVTNDYAMQPEPISYYSRQIDDIWTKLYKVFKYHDSTPQQPEYCVLALISLFFIYCLETVMLTSFRFIVHVKKKADLLLVRCWYGWHFAAIIHKKKKPPLKLLFYAPTMLILAVFYAIFWMIYIVNRNLVKPVSVDMLRKIDIEKFYGNCL